MSPAVAVAVVSIGAIIDTVAFASIVQLPHV